MTHLAQTLKRMIDDWSVLLMETNPLMELTRHGRLSARAFAVYLESLRQLFESSQQNLERAAQRAPLAVVTAARRLGVSRDRRVVDWRAE